MAERVDLAGPLQPFQEVHGDGGRGDGDRGDGDQCDGGDGDHVAHHVQNQHVQQHAPPDGASDSPLPNKYRKENCNE